MKLSYVFPILILLAACELQLDRPVTELESLESKLKNYDSIADREVMVVGTFHFNSEVLQEENQQSIQELLDQLAIYNPTKVLIEWEPKRSERTNEFYRKYKKDSVSIDDKYNEVFQLGLQLAKKLNHDSIYLFDDQTDYLGSLSDFSVEGDPFSFDLFVEYANKEDSGFYNAYEPQLGEVFGGNLKLMDTLNTKSKIGLLNSPEMQRVNAQRMHMYELRVGIQKNWVGPDWIGRWYRRNVRMAANTLKYSESGDRILIIVGDNHKWVLDRLFDDIPDFKLRSSWNLLNKGKLK